METFFGISVTHIGELVANEPHSFCDDLCVKMFYIFFGNICTIVIDRLIISVTERYCRVIINGSLNRKKNRIFLRSASFQGESTVVRCQKFKEKIHNDSNILWERNYTSVNICTSTNDRSFRKTSLRAFGVNNRRIIIIIIMAKIYKTIADLNPETHRAKMSG